MPTAAGHSTAPRTPQESSDEPAGQGHRDKPLLKSLRAPGGADDLSKRTQEAAQQQTNLRAAFRLIGIHLKPLRLAMAFGLVLLVVSTLVGLAQPLAVRLVLDRLASVEPLGTAVLILVALVLLSAICQGIGTFMMQRSAEDVVLSSRRRLIGKLLTVSVPEMHGKEPGDLMARVTADTALIRQIALSSLVQFITGVVMIVGSAVMMAILDLLLFAVTLAVLAVIGLLMGLIMPRIRRSAQQTQRNVGAMGAELERTLGAYTTVKASAAEDDEHERIVDRMARAHDSGIRTALWSSLAAMTSTLAIQAAFLVVLGYGGYRAAAGSIDVPTLIAFLLYAMQLSAPVLQLTQAVTTFQNGRAALERIAEVDGFESELEANPGEAPGTAANLGPVTWDPAVTFRDVVFRYPGTAELALDGVSLTIPQSGLTAIVGPSGSGKSSVLRLIEGFYPIEGGDIRVAGRDLIEWDLEMLRSEIAYVEQDSPAPAGDLWSNLTYGLDDVDETAARDVLRRVGLEERFGDMHEGSHSAVGESAAASPTDAATEDGAGCDDAGRHHGSADSSDVDSSGDGKGAEGAATEGPDASGRHAVGHRGSALSGGERQRLALARALLRKPRVLLLDEATSAQDAGNESMMRDLITGVGQDIAVIVVAHRLSTIRDADQILVLEDGVVQATGTHDELLDSSPLYADLVKAQDTLSASGIDPQQITSTPPGTVTTADARSA